ncbi:MAG: DNRLRE domain-containing protein [Planctomycetota bacterium]
MIIRRAMYLAALALGLFLSTNRVVFAETHTDTFYPIADAFVRSDLPTTSFGDADFLEVGWWPAADNEARTYIKFNVSSIPSNATILTATLQVWCIAMGVQPPATQAGMNPLCITTSSWNESVTWNTHPSHDDSDCDRIYFSSGCPGWHESQYDELEKYVQGWVDGSLSNYGFAGLWDEGSYYCWADFTSRVGDSGDHTHEPRLVVTWEVPNTPPTLNLTQPSSNITVTQGDVVTIEWTDSDPDDNAFINLARDSDCLVGGHTWITVSLREDPDGTGSCYPGSSGDCYEWDTSAVPPGTYRVWGMIDDGTNPEVYNCASGSITIEQPPYVQLTLEGTYSGATPQDIFQPGDDVTVKLQAHNTGGGVDAVTTLNVFDSTYTQPDTDPSKIYDSHTAGEDQTSVLDQDDTDTYSFTFSLPTDAPPGWYRVLGAIREQPWAEVLDTTGPGIADPDWDDGAHLLAFQVYVFRVDSVSIDTDPEDPEPVDQGGTVTGDGTVTGLGDGTVEYRWIVRKPGGAGWASDLLSTIMASGSATIASYTGFPTTDLGQHKVWIRIESPNGPDDSLSNWEFYTVVAPSWPDLRPYLRPDWDDKLVISNVTGTTSSATVIHDNEHIYVDYSCINSGDADAGHFRYGLWIDGDQKTYVDKASLAAGQHSYVLDSDRGILSAGWHTFTIKCDYDTEVDEGPYEGNNEYSRDFYITPAAQPPPAGKWTVVVHGFLVPGTSYTDVLAPDGVLGAIASRIESLGPEGYVVTHTMAMDASGFSLTPSSFDPTKHHVLLFDWTATCGFLSSLLRHDDERDPRDILFDDGYAYGAGDGLYALLRSHDIAQDVFCLIGYSRGAVVVSEATRRLILADLDPQQVIFLDGEGGELWIGYQDHRFDAWQPSPGHSIRFDNIYSDYNEISHCVCPVYLGGHPSLRCWNYDLGDAYSHAGQCAWPCAPEVWRYLSDSMSCDGTRYIYQDEPWNADTDPGLDPHSADHYPESLYHGDFEWNSLAGWFGHGGDGSGHVDCSDEPATHNCHLELDDNDDERIHSWFWLDATYTAFKLWYKISNEDAIACDDYALVELTSGDGDWETWFVSDMCSETDWLYFAQPVPAQFRGKLCQMELWINPGAGGAIDSELRVDDIAFLECTPPATPTNGGADPSTICEGEPSTLTASVSGAVIDWHAGSCGGTFVDTGDSISVSPASNTTYYARARDGSTGCVSSGCDTVVVTVNPLPPTPTNAAADQAEICEGESTTLTASVSGAVIDWYTGGCGETFVDTGNSISVSPASSTTYYARARDGSTECVSTTCDALQVGVVACECVGDDDCDDGLTCTSNTCNIESHECEYTVDAGFCAIDEVCYSDGDLNPGNECEECDPAADLSDWSPRSVGSLCGDPGDVYCDAQDTCDGAATCVDRYKDAGTECRGPTGPCDAAEFCTGVSPECPPDEDQPDGTLCPDGDFCNGEETCQAGVCTDQPGPCGAGEVCDEPSDQCLPDCNSDGVADIEDISSGTSLDCNESGVPDECETLAWGDLDFDGRVGLADYVQFGNCISSPCADPPCSSSLYAEPCCVLADIEPDGDVDLQDFGAFQRAFQGSADCNANGTPDAMELSLAGKVYWTNYYHGEILRANRDGSGAGPIVSSGAGYANGLFVDVAGGWMYWADQHAGIKRARLDGTGITTLFADESGLQDLAVDLFGRKIYWVNAGSDKILRANLDGAGTPQVLFSLGGGAPIGIALDVPRGKVYWAENGGGKVQRGALDGSGSIEHVIGDLGADHIHGLALDSARGYVYWSDPTQGCIRRCDLDGTDQVPVIASSGFAVDLALDPILERIYWTNRSTGKIQWASTAPGSIAEDLVTDQPISLWGIALTTGEDCNQNGVPDECDLTAGTSQDCNTNGVPDECDVGLGISPDCNSNGIPDECEVPFAPVLLVSSGTLDNVVAYHGLTGSPRRILVPSGAGGLDYANGVAIDSAGDVYVSSAESDTVIKYSGLTGQRLQEFATPELDGPVDLVLEPTTLLVVSYSTNSVLKFDLQTSAFLGYRVPPTEHLNGPGAMRLGPDGPLPAGHLLVSSQQSHKVAEFDAEGAFVRFPAENVPFPQGLLFHTDGSLLVAAFSESRVARYDYATGAPLANFVPSGSGGLNLVEGIAWGPNGNLYAVSRETDSVLEYDGDTGAFVREFASGGGLDSPRYLAFGELPNDCNTNAIPDECDLAAGTSADLNGNTVPDECEVVAALLTAMPADQGTLWRTAKNFVRLTFDNNVTAPTEPGQILIQELLEGADNFGPDLSSGFSFTVDIDPKILKIRESATSFDHRKWYAIRNLGDWGLVAPFEVQYVVLMGDVDDDGFVKNADASAIYPRVSFLPKPDDYRWDVDGDGYCKNADASAIYPRVSFQPKPPKPSGH